MPWWGWLALGLAAWAVLGSLVAVQFGRYLRILNEWHERGMDEWQRHWHDG